MKTLLFVLTLLLSATQAFAQADMLDLQQAQLVNAPDVKGWPVTTALTSVSFDGATTRVDFTKKEGPNRWPDVTPKGWQGPLEYTIWLFVNNGGQWVGSGFIQMWNGRDGSGSAGDPDVPSLYDKHWYYAERWSPIFGHGPIHPGEQIGFMVSSGNARDKVGPNSVQERSNIVVFAATDNGHYAFPTAAVTPPPFVAPPPPAAAPPAATPPVAPPTLPSNELGQLFTQAAINHAAEMAELEALKLQLAQVKQDVADFREAVKSKWSAIVNNPVFKYGLAALTGFLATHKWGG